MPHTIETYLKKHAIADAWPLLGACDTDDMECVVVIPALAESAHLFVTLEALCRSAGQANTRAQVIIVVNNLPAAPLADQADNARTLSALAECTVTERFAPLRIAWVDAASSNHAMPEKEGVGWARKLGADHALRLLWALGKAHAPIIHLDADAPPAPGYLQATRAFYQSTERWGGYAAYAHSIVEPDSASGKAIIAYEIYMRYHELALRYAGSPYAHPALGSIMSSTAAAYAATNGMNRRCAGEDFYFMQQLVKTGRLECIPDALVFPSGRMSKRTPFGTGRTVTTGMTSTLFNPDSYRVLRTWLKVAESAITLSGDGLLKKASDIHPALHEYLHSRNFSHAWDRIAGNTPTTEKKRHAFHVWFDGLRTIQLIHHLRDTTCPDIPAPEAVATLLAWLGEDSSITGKAALAVLLQLRQICGVPDQS